MYTNIEKVCAEYAYNISEKVSEKDIIEKAINILHSQGLYSLFLFLESEKPKNKDIRNIEGVLYELLRETVDNSLEDRLQHIREAILTDLDKLILSYNILERCLVYAKYHIRAKEK